MGDRLRRAREICEVGWFWRFQSGVGACVDAISWGWGRGSVEIVRMGLSLRASGDGIASSVSLWCGPECSSVASKWWFCM